MDWFTGAGICRSASTPLTLFSEVTWSRLKLSGGSVLVVLPIIWKWICSADFEESFNVSWVIRRVVTWFRCSLFRITSLVSFAEFYLKGRHKLIFRDLLYLVAIYESVLETRHRRLTPIDIAITVHKPKQLLLCLCYFEFKLILACIRVFVAQNSVTRLALSL
jgi:hypothetical protein